MAPTQWIFKIQHIRKQVNSEVSKIGYGLDDSRLGGPFKADPTIVFTAATQNKQYWRVETKDFYTGKGWSF